MCAVLIVAYILKILEYNLPIMALQEQGIVASENVYRRRSLLKKARVSAAVVLLGATTSTTGEILRQTVLPLAEDTDRINQELLEDGIPPIHNGAREVENTM